MTLNNLYSTLSPVSRRTVVGTQLHQHWYGSISDSGSPFTSSQELGQEPTAPVENNTISSSLSTLTAVEGQEETTRQPAIDLTTPEPVDDVSMAVNLSARAFRTHPPDEYSIRRAMREAYFNFDKYVFLCLEAENKRHAERLKILKNKRIEIERWLADVSMVKTKEDYDQASFFNIADSSDRSQNPEHDA